MKRISISFLLTLCLIFIGSSYQVGYANQELYNVTTEGASQLSIDSSNQFSTNNKFGTSLKQNSQSELKFKLEGFNFESEEEENIHLLKQKLKNNYKLIPAIVPFLSMYVSQLVVTFTKTNEQYRFSNSIEAIVHKVCVFRI